MRAPPVLGLGEARAMLETRIAWWGLRGGLKDLREVDRRTIVAVIAEEPGRARVIGIDRVTGSMRLLATARGGAIEEAIGRTTGA